MLKYFTAFTRCHQRHSTLQKMVGGKYRFYSGLVSYEVPVWASGLRQIPKYKVQLAHLNTPIHKWNLPGIPEGFDVYIKRDDMTGSTLSGNKVRKLEFLLADAVEKGCKHVITCGGLQSNHCRATAIAANQLGLKPHLLLRGDAKAESEVGCSGNVFLDRLSGADIYICPTNSPQETHLKPRMSLLAQKIKKETGEDSYIICVGGSDTVGFYGYLSAFEELMQQGLHENFDDIVFGCGSGGTADGLAIGNYLNGQKIRLHGVAVSDDAAYFHNHTGQILSEVGLPDLKAETLYEVIEGHKGRGYGLSTQEELDFIVKVSTTTGIMIDPVYTGKAVKGFVHELNTNPDRFKGKRILFLHTGGIFGMYDGRLDTTIQNSGAETNHVKMWLEVDQPPF